MYGVSCISLGLPLKFFHYDFALMYAQIPPSPDNFKRLYRLHFVMVLN